MLVRSSDRRTQPGALWMGKPDTEAGGAGRAQHVSATAASRAGPLAPPGRWARAAADYRPLHAPSRNRPPPGQDSLSHKADRPGSLGTTVPCRPFMSTDHRLGRTPHPPKLVRPGHWELLPRTGPP